MSIIQPTKFFKKHVTNYSISCFKQDFPELTSSTTVPLVPQIIEDSIHRKNNSLTFQIIRDPLVALYDIYLFTNSTSYTERIRRPESGNIFVEIDLVPNESAEGFLIIYAYDLQLSEYITYNVSIKPNTYRSDYSTVDNGFGCFGSLNILKRIITF